MNNDKVFWLDSSKSFVSQMIDKVTTLIWPHKNTLKYINDYLSTYNELYKDEEYNGDNQKIVKFKDYYKKLNELNKMFIKNLNEFGDVAETTNLKDLNLDHKQKIYNTLQTKFYNLYTVLNQLLDFFNNSKKNFLLQQQQVVKNNNNNNTSLVLKKDNNKNNEQEDLTLTNSCRRNNKKSCNVNRVKFNNAVEYNDIDASSSNINTEKKAYKILEKLENLYNNKNKEQDKKNNSTIAINANFDKLINNGNNDKALVFEQKNYNNDDNDNDDDNSIDDDIKDYYQNNNNNNEEETSSTPSSNNIILSYDNAAKIKKQLKNLYSNIQHITEEFSTARI